MSSLFLFTKPNTKRSPLHVTKREKRNKKIKHTHTHINKKKTKQRNNKKAVGRAMEWDGAGYSSCVLYLLGRDIAAFHLAIHISLLSLQKWMPELSYYYYYYYYWFSLLFASNFILFCIHHQGRNPERCVRWSVCIDRNMQFHVRRRRTDLKLE